ncbi:MAG: cytochrome P450 [Pseudomonadota bacterium]
MQNVREPIKVPLPRLGREARWGFFKTLQEMRSNVLRIIPDIALKQPIVTGQTFGIRWHMVMDPEALGHILKDRLNDYPKSTVTKSILEPAIGDSLFVAEGAHWRWQRRVAAPVFTARNIANLGPFMTDAAGKVIERLGDRAGEADLYDEMTRATFDVIASVTFSGSGDLESDQIFDAIDTYIEQVAKVSVLDILGAPKWIPRPSRLFGPDSMKRTKEIADQAIEARKQAGPKNIPDLLDLLMAGEDPKTARKMNLAEIRDNLLTFIVAGHETTALTLSWALYLLAFDKNVQNRMRAETAEVLGGRLATAEDVPNLRYTKQVIQETLRLYPPAAFLSRTAQSDDQLVDRQIKRGETVMLPVYALHRNELLWDNPDQFDPDRFADGKQIARYAFLPFGDGPRICIGAQFAYSEAAIILASLVDRFEFDPIEGREPQPKMIFTLRPEGGVPLSYKPL